MRKLRNLPTLQRLVPPVSRWTLPILVAIALAVGCKGREPSSQRSPNTSATPAKASVTSGTQAAELLRAEVPEAILERVRSDALRFFARSPATQKLWPSEEEKALAYYHSLKMLAKLARANHWPTSKTLATQLEELMYREKRAKVYAKEMGEITVSDDEIRNFYQAHIGEYRTRGRFWIRHIFLDVVDHPDQKKQKKAIGEKIVADLKAGKSFVELAEKYSDVEGDKGEVVGPLPYGEINPQLEKVIVQLKPGETSDLVESKYGYNIFLLEKIERPTTKTLEEVRLSIERQIRSRKQKDAFEKATAALEARYPVEKRYAVLNNSNPAADEIVVSSKFLNITVGSYRKRIEEIPPSIRPPLLTPSDRALFLDEWVERERIKHAAALEKLDSDPEMIAIKRYITDRTLAVAAMNELVKKVPQPTDEELEKFYKETPRLSVRPEQVRLRELVIQYDVPSTASKRRIYLAQKEALTTAKKVLAELKAGADFAKMVRKYSTGPSAKKNDGELGLVFLQTRNKDLVAEINKIKVGQWTAPIMEYRRKAVTIYKLEERKPKELLPMNDVRKARARNLLMRQKRAEMTNRIQAALAQAYREDITAQEIQKIVDNL